MNKDVKVAYIKGYQVVDGVVYGVAGGKIRVFPNNTGYLGFAIRNGPGNPVKVLVHRLVAYQKFGGQIFQKGLQVRHIDGNKLNNREDNIEIGTQSDNMMDRSLQDRRQHAARAASFLRRFTDVEVEEIRSFYADVKSYKVVMVRYNIRSKGSLHYLLHHDYQQLTGLVTDPILSDLDLPNGVKTNEEMVPR